MPAEIPAAPGKCRHPQPCRPETADPGRTAAGQRPGNPGRPGPESRFRRPEHPPAGTAAGLHLPALAGRPETERGPGRPGGHHPGPAAEDPVAGRSPEAPSHLRPDPESQGPAGYRPGPVPESPGRPPVSPGAAPAAAGLCHGNQHPRLQEQMVRSGNSWPG